MKLTLTILIAAGFAITASAKDITVAPGDSLTKARDEAKSGDRILLKGGTYRLA